MLKNVRKVVAGVLSIIVARSGDDLRDVGAMLGSGGFSLSHLGMPRFPSAWLETLAIDFPEHDDNDVQICRSTRRPFVTSPDLFLIWSRQTQTPTIQC